MQQPNGIFCISLDFELHWGVFDKKTVEENERYFLDTREHVTKLLAVFEANEIHCTWATVGALAAKTQEELSSNIQQIAVVYDQVSYMPDKVRLGAGEADDPSHFANSLIEVIQATPHQELGSHTYSHFYTLESGSTISAFKRDLQLAKKVLNNPESLVYPRNQYSDAHLKAAKEAGILTARSNPSDWFWSTEAQSQESLRKKVVRTLDHYFKIGKDTTYELTKLETSQDSPLLQPASRFLRPPSSIDKLLGKRKVKRILKEMTYAAKNSRIYHLWWHPHNFSVNSEQSFSELNQIVEHFNQLKKDYGFESNTMVEIFKQVSHGL